MKALMMKICNNIFWADSVAGPVLMIAALCLVLVYVGFQESQSWERFAKTHECRVVEKSDGQLSQAIGVSPAGNPGQAIIYTPGKTAYACNDGITYWR